MNLLKTIISLVLLLVLFVPFSGSANDADRELMRKILADVEDGINTKDFSKIKDHLHHDVIITFQNAELTKGVSGAEQYMNKIFEGPAAILKSFTTKATVDQPAIFYGNTAVAAGYTNERYEFTDDMGFDLYTRWSATLLKENGQWKVIALHFSNNLFDNAILDKAKQANYIYATIGFIAGLILLWIVFWLTRKKRHA
ncbi:MAG: nuclear transport factor 2 family protein [Gammaproteobacteria bacterium]